MRYRTRWGDQLEVSDAANLRTMRLHRAGDFDDHHRHQWKMEVSEEDQYIWWDCRGCRRRYGCEIDID